MIIMTYYCRHCNRNFFKHIPVCEMNKETTECKYCGKTAKLSPALYFLHFRKENPLVHKDLTETLNNMKGER